MRNLLTDIDLDLVVPVDALVSLCVGMALAGEGDRRRPNP